MFGANAKLQTGSKLTGSRKHRVSERFDMAGMLPYQIRLLVTLPALYLFDVAQCRIGAVRLIVLICLGCLTWLHSDWSMPHSAMPESRIEGLGRKLWGTNNGRSVAARPP